MAKGDGCAAGAGETHFEYSAGCPSGFMPLVLAGLLLYLAAFSPGLGPVPWAVNAEIFPSQARPTPLPCLYFHLRFKVLLSFQGSRFNSGFGTKRLSLD